MSCAVSKSTQRAYRSAIKGRAERKAIESGKQEFAIFSVKKNGELYKNPTAQFFGSVEQAEERIERLRKLNPSSKFTLVSY